MVGEEEFESPTFSTSKRRSSQLSYPPDSICLLVFMHFARLNSELLNHKNCSDYSILVPKIQDLVGVNLRYPEDARDLRRAIFNGFLGGPVFDVDETVEGGDKVVIGAITADIAVDVIAKIDLIDTDGRGIFDPVIQE